MTTGIIRDERQYHDALQDLEVLVLGEPAPGTPKRARIELLALLIEEYEKRVYPIDLPDPVEAIKFRMDQEGLTQRDLVPIIGSRSKVSEVLNRKRALTLPMIRALHSGLGIPARVLIRQDDASLIPYSDVDWSAFPLKDMLKRGWVRASRREIERDPEAIVRRFLAPLDSLRTSLALYRTTGLVRSARTMDRYSLAAWTARLQLTALEGGLAQSYRGGVDKAYMRELAHLSLSDSGPRLAVEMLGAVGIALVIEPHLPGTYLDGAAIVVDEERPIIGMTLRHDRLDNFWFTLMHELSHVVLHLESDYDSFIDDLEFDDPRDPSEEEADRLAGEVLVPAEEWSNSAASRLKSAEAAEHLARKLGIHVAIVAGRMRHDFKNYRILGQLVGHGGVRSLFPDVKWDL